MMRRRFGLLAAGLTALMMIPLAALADDGLEEMLETGASGEFHGTGVLMCSWGDQSAGSTYDVTRSDGVSMVHGPSGDLMVSGTTSAVRSGTEWYGMEVGRTSEWALSDRYTMTAARQVTRMGRDAGEVFIMEDGAVRARLIVDSESGVPLLTEIFDGNGEMFRVAAMVEFSAGHTEMDEMPDIGEMERSPMQPMSTGVVNRDVSLPVLIAGYRLSDSYPGGQGVIQVYYSDGLFSFSVFESKRTATPAAFKSAHLVEMDGSIYRTLVTPSNIWVQWHAPDKTYVLVGDLPPDHLREVLAGLPEPGERAFFIRLWRRLFG